MIGVLNNKIIRAMVDLIFEDTITGEIFEIRCFLYEIHSIEQKDKDLAKWCQGRIIKRTQINI